MILDPGLRLQPRGRVHGPGTNRADRLADVVRPEASGEHDAALDGRGALEVERILRVPGQVDHLDDRVPVAKELRLAAAHPAFLVRVELNEVGRRLLGLADEDRDTQPVVRHVEDFRRAPRAPLREDEAEHVGAGFDRRVDVLASRQTADLDERP